MALFWSSSPDSKSSTPERCQAAAQIDPARPRVLSRDRHRRFLRPVRADAPTSLSLASISCHCWSSRSIVDFLAADAGRDARVVPKIRLRHLGFEFLKVCGHASEVKDAPGVPTLARQRPAHEARISSNMERSFPFRREWPRCVRFGPLGAKQAV